MEKESKYLHYELESGERITVKYIDNKTSYSELFSLLINKFKGVIPSGKVIHSLPIKFTSHVD